MNTQLVESILQVIDALPEEDRLLLETRLEQKKKKTNILFFIQLGNYQKANY